MNLSRFAGAFLLLILILPTTFVSQSGPCDPGLRTDGKNPNSYRLREDRCEGQYIEGQSGSSALLIASLTEAFEVYRTDTGQALIVDWDAPDRSLLHIRAKALRARYYYRMDTLRPTDQSSFTWPISILAALGLSSKQIGIVAWTQRQIGKHNIDLYLPVRVAQQRHAARSKTLQLVVVPQKELKQVTISLSLIDSDGRVIEDLRKD